ncbi:DUF899 family protein [Novosphingobium sp. AP12]|uniref:DUF899 family protein n=1 Tax=Novosphingobium sp. AP12 TaxID=1144305 RepID=UPI000271F19E|nr:DUF899 family protein [Novosphingobium sp. AP12]EJL24456.1 hypothetical protein PMI02_03707 [Novosphingobium sp. AP12]
MEKSLPPANELAALRKPRFAGETSQYAAAREALLAHEIEARRQLGRLAAQLRELPPGPAIDADYRFIDTNGSEIGLADMFGGHDTLVVYHWMYGPDRERPCPMCTNLIGPLAANAADLLQRVGLAVVARSPVERQIAFAIERGWREVPFYQAVGDAFSLAVGGLDPEKGWEMPVLMVLVKEGDKVRLHWMGETTQDMADPGEDPRGATEIAPLWTVLDLTPRGRGKDWYPKLSYLP